VVQDPTLAGDLEGVRHSGVRSHGNGEEQSEVIS